MQDGLFKLTTTNWAKRPNLFLDSIGGNQQTNKSNPVLLNAAVTFNSLAAKCHNFKAVASIQNQVDTIVQSVEHTTFENSWLATQEIISNP